MTVLPVVGQPAASSRRDGPQGASHRSPGRIRTRRIGLSCTIATELRAVSAIDATGVRHGIRGAFFEQMGLTAERPAQAIAVARRRGFCRVGLQNSGKERAGLGCHRGLFGCGLRRPGTEHRSG